VRPRERGEGQDLGLGLVHQRPDLRERPGELVMDLVPGVADGLGVTLGEDRAEYRRDHVGVRLRHVGEQVPGEVDPAPLVRGALEGPLPSAAIPVATTTAMDTTREVVLRTLR
jgi:hypothetical protein